MALSFFISWLGGKNLSRLWNAKICPDPKTKTSLVYNQVSQIEGFWGKIKENSIQYMEKLPNDAKYFPDILGETFTFICVELFKVVYSWGIWNFVIYVVMHFI